jgi:methionyl-tRNA synthetase
VKEIAMAFMEPEIIHTTMYSAEKHEETLTFPSVHFGKADVASEADVEEAEIEEQTGWWARLSAPGYMDATDWSGPFDSEAEAKAALAEEYDLCPKCLEELNTDYKCDACETGDASQDAQAPTQEEAAEAA